MLVFIGAGLLFTITGGLLIGLMCAGDLRGLKRWVVICSIALIIGFSFSGGLCLEAKQDEHNWNGGNCQCGGKWDLINVEHLKNNSDLYYYECGNCNCIIKTHQYMKRGD